LNYEHNFTYVNHIHFEMVQNQARRQDLATEVSKNQKGGAHF